MRALLAVVGLAGAAQLWWLADQWLAVRVLRSPHVVYFLIDRRGVVLYVGSTNDPDRRFAEHVEDEPGEWRQRIWTMVTVRHCRSMRQARRIERRMIRALVDGARVRMCKRVWNVALVARSPVPSPSRLVWLVVYRLNGAVWPACRWHAPNLGREDGRPTPVNGTPLHASWGADDPSVDPSADPVSTADSPQEAPLGAPAVADASATDDTPGTTPPERTPLRVVPDPPSDEQPADKAAKRRAANARYKRESRARLAAQKRAAE